MSYHAVVWLDHQTAKVFSLRRDGFTLLNLSGGLPHGQTHNRAGNLEWDKAQPDRHFFDAIINALRPSSEWLIIGPGSARDELASYVRRTEPLLAQRIIAVEPCDHPTDNQIAAFARIHFRAADGMLPS